MLVGVPLTLVFYRFGAVDSLPGLWLLLYGTGIVKAGAFSIRIVPNMGLCFQPWVSLRSSHLHPGAMR